MNRWATDLREGFPDALRIALCGLGAVALVNGLALALAWWAL